VSDDPPPGATVPVAAAALPPSSDVTGELAPGTVLSRRYRIDRFLARGGMGAVYAAFDLELETRVALKALLGTTWSAEALAQFKQEIQLARTVTHPNVCRLFDLGQHVDGEHRVVFLTMELLDGPSLAERIRSGPLPVARAVPIVRQICAGLAAAHASNVIHGDLKPANVLLVEGIRAVVTDFGLAGKDDTENVEVAGTPDYMAPELLRGEPRSVTSDVFALGVLMFELVTGELPWTRASSFAAATNRSAARRLPGGFGGIIERCLALDPAARFQSVADVATRLPTQGPSRAWPWLAAATAMVAIMALWLARSASAPADPASPRDPSAARQYADGVARLRVGDEAGAAAALRAAIASEPTFALAHAELAGALLGLGDYAAARDEAARASSLSGSLGREHAAVIEARVRETTDHWDRAIETYEELRRIAPNELEYGLRLAYAQIYVGHFREGQTVLDDLRTRGAVPARLDMLDAFMALRQGDWPRLLAATRKAIASADAAGAGRLGALAWDEQGDALHNLGRAAEAEAAFVEAERRFRALGDRSGLARVTLHRGLALVTSDRDRALALLDEAAEIYRSLGNRDGEAQSLGAIGMALPPSRIRDARTRYQAALALYRAAGDRGNVAVTLFNLASVHYKLGDSPAFHETLGEVLTAARASGTPSTVAEAAINLGLVTLAEGDPPRARLLFDEAGAAARTLGDPLLSAYVQWGLAETARARADDAAAQTGIDAVLADAAHVPDPSVIEQARCTKARITPGGDVTAACSAASAALETAGLADEAVVTAWQVSRAAIAGGDRRTARAVVQRIAKLAATSQDVHTALLARLAHAETEDDRDALAVIEREATALHAIELAFEARFARGLAERRAGARAESDATLLSLAADASSRSMTALARRCDAARAR
jgi:tetratricopeptide (TPR) repeat protein